jgi:hypothetical protein
MSFADPLGARLLDAVAPVGAPVLTLDEPEANADSAARNEPLIDDLRFSKNNPTPPTIAAAAVPRAIHFPIGLGADFFVA